MQAVQFLSPINLPLQNTHNKCFFFTSSFSSFSSISPAKKLRAVPILTTETVETSTVDYTSLASLRRLLPPVGLAEASTLVFGSGLILVSSGWYHFHGRSANEERKTEEKMQMLMENLDRKKNESPEAFLQTIHRETEAVGKKLEKWRHLADWEVNNCNRRVAVLKSKLDEWTKGESNATRPALKKKIWS